MPPPQQTEVHFLDLLEVLSHPLPAGYHLLAIARFLQDFTAPAMAEPYLAELGSRMPVVRMPGDIDGINPQELETALQTIEACSAPSTTFGSDAQFREILSHWRRAPPFAYWRVGEYARALQILGVSVETLPSWTPERGQTSVTAVRTRAEGLLTEAARKRHNAAEALLVMIVPSPPPSMVTRP